MDRGNLELIKKINRSLVLETIRSEQPITRAEIAKKLNLSRSTVSQIVDDFLRKKLVEEIGLGHSTEEGGRRGIQLVFNPRSAYGIGVDIGGTKILMVATDLDGNLVYREKVPTDPNPYRIVEIIQSFIQKSSIPDYMIAAMGIGVPAIVDSKKGIVIDAPSLNWQQFSFITFMKKYFPYPIFVNNDVNCAAIGERWLGAGKDVDDLFFVAIGTGVGSAIISNGQLIEGSSYSAGEIGYLLEKHDVLNNNLNTFGEFGVFERKTSGLALAKHGYTAQELFKEYDLGNPAAVKVIDEFILDLSVMLANAVCLLNPKRIVIGGGVSLSLARILPQIQENVAKFVPISTEIRLSHLGGDAGALGAVGYALEKIQVF